MTDAPALSLHTAVCDLLGCTYPLVLAGMGGVARSELVTAVTLAGGFGFLGMVREPVALIHEEVHRIRERTSRPFGVNLIPAATGAALLEAQLASCIELNVPVVCLFWDLDTKVVKRLRDAGILVVYQVGSAAEAQAAQDAGANILIAQGIEAGGHVRGSQPLAQVLAQTLAVARVPVLAAGGLADGADLARVLAQGAQGAVLGTAFIATRESFAHDFHIQRILEGAAADTLLTTDFHINWPAGAKVRVLRNSVTLGRHGAVHNQARQVIGMEGERPIYLFSTDSPLRSMTGDFEAMALYAGAGLDRIQAVSGAGDRVAAIVRQAAALLPASAAAPAPRSSPVCYADEADDAYMGFIPPQELAQQLGHWLGQLQALALALAPRPRDGMGPGTDSQAPLLRSRVRQACERLTQVLLELNALPADAPPVEATLPSMAPQGDLAALQDDYQRFREALQQLLPKIRNERIQTPLFRLLAASDDKAG